MQQGDRTLAVFARSPRPLGFRRTDRARRLAQVAAPPIVGGSHDPLLEWALRESNSGLASLPEGSEEGLRRLTRGEVMVAAIHLHRLDGDDESANLEAVADAAGLHDAVVLGFARREQGILVAPGNPLGLSDMASIATSRARMAQRPAGAGAQLLLLALLARAGIGLDELKLAKPAFPTGPDIAQAIRAGRIDCGIATRSRSREIGRARFPAARLGTFRPRDAAARLFHEGTAGAVRLHARSRACATARPNSAAMMSATPARCGS